MFRVQPVPRRACRDDVAMPRRSTAETNRAAARVVPRDCWTRWHGAPLGGPDNLSGGQQRRVAIRALAVEPDYLLLRRPPRAGPRAGGRVIKVMVELARERRSPGGGDPQRAASPAGRDHIVFLADSGVGSTAPRRTSSRPATNRSALPKDVLTPSERATPTPTPVRPSSASAGARRHLAPARAARPAGGNAAASSPAGRAGRAQKLPDARRR
ncbi:hypothetical protein QJS66_15335 [Kocuria rhizophila]|nr:hypothetical protein QJS66_15335 [Kocuria rhizophila]